MAEARRRAVLITGCSTGFGLAAAVAAARRGWQVFATMRDPARRRPLDEAAEAAGVTVEVVQLDVCDAGSVDRAITEVLGATGGELAAVVNNAGIGDAGFFEDMPDDQARHVMETNFFGTLTVTRAALPALRAAGDGRIVIVSSVAAFGAQAGLSAYVASKWAVEGWAESLALEVAPFGVRVALVEPGAYRTGIWENAVIATPAGSPYAGLRETVQEKFLAMIERSARDPAEAGERIARLLEERRPRFRNPVGPDAHIAQAAQWLMPTQARFRLMRRMVGLPGNSSLASAPARAASREG